MLRSFVTLATIHGIRESGKGACIPNENVTKNVWDNKHLFLLAGSVLELNVFKSANLTMDSREYVLINCTQTLFYFSFLSFRKYQRARERAPTFVQLFRERLSEKVHATKPERYCGWFLVHCFSKKFQRMAREAMDICLRVLKESNKSSFDSYSVRNKSLIISHITFQDCRVHSFRQPFSK